MVSNASEDFPEPLKPVITVKVLRGISTSIFFKLCCRAPCTVMRLIIARGKLHFSSAWLVAGGWWVVGSPGVRREAPQCLALRRVFRTPSPCHRINGKLRGHASPRKRDFGLRLCFVRAAVLFYFSERCDHFSLG